MPDNKEIRLNLTGAYNKGLSPTVFSYTTDIAANIEYIKLFTADGTLMSQLNNPPQNVFISIWEDEAINAPNSEFRLLRATASLGSIVFGVSYSDALSKYPSIYSLFFSDYTETAGGVKKIVFTRNPSYGVNGLDFFNLEIISADVTTIKNIGDFIYTTGTFVNQDGQRRVKEGSINSTEATAVRGK